MTIDELSEYGMARMDDAEIEGFLSSQSVGVLGLPAEPAPSMRPLSFEFDADDARLYLLYVLGAESRKRDLSEQTDVARFLVYRAETAFNWRSVLLTGSLDVVPDDELKRVRETVEFAWRPDLFERASEAMTVTFYEFRIEEQTGVKHMGLPPAFESETGSD